MILLDAVWVISLAGMGLVAAGFIFVIWQARAPAASDEAKAKSAHNAHRLQGGIFGALLLVFFVGSWATLRNYPIPSQHGAIDAQQVVNVVGRMWSWQIDPATVQVNQSVEFRVTSVDVNHGFAIYAPDGRIVTQTQAMPGYINKVLYTFTKPGTYTVQCLEYCGIGHVPMASSIQVIAAKGK